MEEEINEILEYFGIGKEKDKKKLVVAFCYLKDEKFVESFTDIYLLSKKNGGFRKQKIGKRKGWVQDFVIFKENLYDACTSGVYETISNKLINERLSSKFCIHDNELYDLKFSKVEKVLKNETVIEMPDRDNLLTGLASYDGKLCLSKGDCVIDVFTEEIIFSPINPYSTKIHGICSIRNNLYILCPPTVYDVDHNEIFTHEEYSINSMPFLASVNGELYYIADNQLYSVFEDRLIAKRASKITAIGELEGKLIDCTEDGKIYSTLDNEVIYEFKKRGRIEALISIDNKLLKKIKKKLKFYKS